MPGQLGVRWTGAGIRVRPDRSCRNFARHASIHGSPSAPTASRSFDVCDDDESIHSLTRNPIVQAGCGKRSAVKGSVPTLLCCCEYNLCAGRSRPKMIEAGTHYITEIEGARIGIVRVASRGQINLFSCSKAIDQRPFDAIRYSGSCQGQRVRLTRCRTSLQPADRPGRAGRRRRPPRPRDPRSDGGGTWWPALSACAPVSTRTGRTAGPC
jgi:hypothetical protein